MRVGGALLKNITSANPQSTRPQDNFLSGKQVNVFSVRPPKTMAERIAKIGSVELGGTNNMI